MHFHGKRALPLDRMICNTNGCGVVMKDLCFWLWMSQSFKGKSKIIPYLQFQKRAPNSALAAKETMKGKMVHSMKNVTLGRMGPRLFGGGTLATPQGM
jgi:hypothetical protein